MDAVAKLLRDAKFAGVRVSAVNGRIRIEAAKSQRHWIDRLQPHEHELLGILGANGHANGSSPAAPVVRPCTDLANGERFAEQHGADVRYIHEWHRWYVWNNQRWQQDNSGEIMRLAKGTAKRILVEAADAPDDQCKQLTTHAHASQSRPRLEAMVELSKSEQPIPLPHESLDADGWLLGCENGVVDLRTGELRPHDRADLITKTTGVEYPDEPGVDAVLWTDFLSAIFAGDADLIGFLQRLLGSALVGVVVEHILPIFWGNGANGKSVLIETALAALGDYALKAPAGLLINSRGERHPTELVDLHGKRLVAITETGDGQRLDERLTKELTGGDTIRARRMRENFWSFRPSHLAVMVTNYKPTVRGVDFGLWRRLRLVPFTVTIPEADQDKHLSEKLRGELPAILKWMVNGCLAWQREGLNAPPQVLAATDEYKLDSDTFAEWANEKLLVEPSMEIKASEAYANYLKWCEDNGERNHLGRKRFGERMLPRIDGKRVSNGTYYQGVSLIVG